MGGVAAFIRWSKWKGSSSSLSAPSSAATDNARPIRRCADPDELFV